MTTVMPGFMILRRPSAPDVEELWNHEPLQATGSLPSLETVEPPATRYVAGVLTIWLEVVAGRRPMSAVQRGPYHPRVVHTTEEMRQQCGTRVAVHVKSVHVQDPISSAKGYRHEARFCATVLLEGRVRALAGSFCLRRVAVPTPLNEVRMHRGSRRTNQWRLETLHVV